MEGVLGYKLQDALLLPVTPRAATKLFVFLLLPLHPVPLGEVSFRFRLLLGYGLLGDLDALVLARTMTGSDDGSEGIKQMLRV